MILFTQKNPPKWLSEEIDRKYKKPKGKKCFLAFFNDLIAPKWKGMLMAVLALILSYCFPLKNHAFFTKILAIDKSLLITTHAGICLIIFALLIFVVETAKNGPQNDKLRVLLDASYIYPIAMMAIYIFLILLVSPLSFIGVGLLVLIGISTIIAISKTINLLLNRVEFTEAMQKMLKSRFLSCIEQEAKERIGNNLLNTKFEDRSMVVFSSSEPNENSYYPIVLKQSGVITDINLARLKGLLDGLQNRCNENVLAENNPPIRDSSEKQQCDNKKPPKLFLCPYYFDTNSTDGRVGWVHRNILEHQEDLSNRIAKIVKIDTLASNFSENVNLEIDNLQSECINAIKSSHLSTVKECARLYIQLAITFSEYFYKINKGYSAKDAKKEVRGIAGGWKQAEGLRDNISALIEVAALSNNIRVVREIIYIPFAIIKRTFSFYDHYIFQTFVGCSSLIYQQKNTSHDKEINDFLCDRAWRYLNEVNSLYLLPQLNRAEDENKKSSMKDFAIQFVLQAITLLRLSFEKNNADDFFIFIDNIGNLYENHYGNNKTIEELRALQQELLFCLGAWMLYKYDDDCFDEQKMMLEKIILSFPDELGKITQIFLETRGDFVYNDDISIWYAVYDGRAHSIPTLEWQQKFYWLLALKLIAKTSVTDIKNLSLPVDQKLFELVENNACEFMTQLTDMVENKSCCNNLLSEEEFDDDKVNALKATLKKAALAQHEKNKQQIEKAALDGEKCKYFIDSVLKGYEKPFSLSLRDLFGEKKECHRNDVEADDIAKFGYKRLEPKDGFVTSDQNIDMSFKAEDLGRNLLCSENTHIFREIKEKCIPSHLSNLAEYLNKKFNTHKDILLLANSNFPLYKLAKQDRLFKMSWQMEQDAKFPEIFANHSADCYYQWRNEWLPVYQIYSNGNSKDIQLLVLNKKHLLRFTQTIYPLNEKIFHDGRFYIDIRAFSHDAELLEELLRTLPEWLIKYGDEQAQTKHLKQNVLFEMYEHFSLSFSNEFSGAVIEITDAN